MSEEMFGPEPEESEEWGGDPEPGDPGGESVDRGVQDLGDGIFIRVPDEVIKGLLRAPEAVAAIQQRGQQVCDLANSNHVTKDALYETRFVDNPSYKRPVVFVKPANFKAVIDEKTHSTLLAAASQVGSDPLIEAGDAHSAEMAVEE